MNSSMPKYNRKCNFCGNTYYVCLSCISKKSWKNVCCSPECFIKLFENKDMDIEPQKINEGEIKNMIGVLHDKTKIEIIGYDLILGRFDDLNRVTRTFEDFDKFELSSEELKEISLMINKHTTDK